MLDEEMLDVEPAETEYYFIADWGAGGSGRHWRFASED